MSQTPRSADQLILDAATRVLALTPDQLQQVLEHVARAGFDPKRSVRAKGLAGMAWRGQVLVGRDLLTSAERHYLRRVVRRQEWPGSTSLGAYITTVRAIILDPKSSIFTSRHRQIWQLGAVRESGELRGPRGYDWVLVEYRPELHCWVTAYQLPDLQDLHTPERTHFQWLRQPS